MGMQYSSKAYQNMLEENGLIGSMNRLGCPYYNACAKSFLTANANASVERDMIQWKG